MIGAAQSFVVAEECRKAARQNGYRRRLGEEGGWARYGSTTAQGDILLAAQAAEGPCFLALDHPGVIAELGLAPAEMPGPGRARFAFARLGDLYAALPRVAGTPSAGWPAMRNRIYRVRALHECDPRLRRAGSFVSRRVEPRALSGPYQSVRSRSMDFGQMGFESEQVPTALKTAFHLGF